MLELHDKTAIITGASSGIGAETARVFSRQGAAVVLVARRAALLEELSKRIIEEGARVLIVPGDVTRPGFAEDVCERTVEAFGCIDILVNNAGISDHHSTAARTTDELWERNIAVNQTAPFRFCRAALRYMTDKGSGVIVNVSSIGGIYSIAGAPYSSSKRALLGLTKNLSVQYAGTGIRCNAVCPGPTDTDMLRSPAPADEQMMEITGRRIDMNGGLSEAADMANAILFLSADESRFINGQALVVDKGCCL